MTHKVSEGRAVKGSATRTADHAYGEVRTRLLDGSYATGELLREEAVAVELDLPQGAVHEAFARLRHEGALRLYPARGALVLPISVESARHVTEARLLLEIFALDSVAARGRPALRELGLELLAGLHEVSTSQEAMELGRAFHNRLVESAGNPVVAELHAALWGRTRDLAAASTAGDGHPEKDVAEHTAIAEAMARGSGGEAREMLHRHVSSALRRIGVADEFALPRPADT